MFRYCFVIVLSQQKLLWNIWILDISLGKSASWLLMVWQILSWVTQVYHKLGRVLINHCFQHRGFWKNEKINTFSLWVVDLFTIVRPARHASVRTGCLDALRQLAALLHCPLLFAEDQVCATITEHIFILKFNLLARKKIRTLKWKNKRNV